MNLRQANKIISKYKKRKFSLEMHPRGPYIDYLEKKAFALCAKRYYTAIKKQKKAGIKFVTDERLFELIEQAFQEELGFCNSKTE